MIGSFSDLCLVRLDYFMFFLGSWPSYICMCVSILEQGSQIRIYDVDRGWKVQKNVMARSLRWTITDTSLSPDQQHLVSSHLVLHCFLDSYSVRHMCFPMEMVGIEVKIDHIFTFIEIVSLCNVLLNLIVC